MTRTITLRLPYPSFTGNHQYGQNKRGKGKHLLPEVHDYRRHVWLIWMQAGKPHFESASIDWKIITPDNRQRDFDDLSKIVLDALAPPVPTTRLDRARTFPNDSMRVISHGQHTWLRTDARAACVELTIWDTSTVEGVLAMKRAAAERLLVEITAMEEAG